jgi:hypothetical protein
MILATALAVAALLTACPWIVGRAASVVGGGLAMPAHRPAGPTYQGAIADLAVVRLRLLETQQLTEQARAAIDTLTLALVAGSDQ